jgi:hypothetical protein
MADVAISAFAEAVTDEDSGQSLTPDGSLSARGSNGSAGDASRVSVVSTAGAATTFACDRCGKAYSGLPAQVQHWRS